MRLALLGRKIGFKGDDLVAGIIGIPVVKILTKAEKNADTGATSLPKVLNVPFSTILMYSGVPVLT